MMVSLIISLVLEITGLFQIIAKHDIQLGLSLLLVGVLYEISLVISVRLRVIEKELSKIHKSLWDLFDKKEVK